MILLGETKYCLESNFIIDLLNGKENAVSLYREIKNTPLTITVIASVVLFEIMRGKEENQNKIQEFKELRQELTVLPFDEKEAEEASRIEKAMHQEGQTIAPLDLLIAATAKTNNAILVSNDRDYDKIDGLRLKKY